VDIFQRLERHLEQAVDRLFGAGPERRLRAQTLAGALAQAAREGALSTLQTTLMPNRYLIRLNPEDAKSLLPVFSRLTEELRDFLYTLAEQSHYEVPAPIVLRAEAAEEIPAGEVQVEARVTEGQPQATLTVEQGADAGAIYELLPNVTLIGRAADCGITLSDNNVSRHHCEIRFAEGRFTISDLGSTNGTLLNGRTVTRERLEDGDSLELGATVMTFHLH